MKDKIITFSFLFFAAFNALAQGSSPSFQFLNQSSGLSELSNAFISEDSEGFVWISSTDGLNRFDGKNIVLFHSNLKNDKNATILTSKTFEDKNKNIWFTTINALHRIDYLNQKVTSQLLNSVKYTEIQAFHFDKNSNEIWIKADSFLILFNVFTKKETCLGKLPINALRCYPIFNVSGRVTAVVSTFFGNGISINTITQKGETKEETFFKGKTWGKMAEEPIYNLYVENDTTIWFATTVGLGTA